MGGQRVQERQGIPVGFVRLEEGIKHGLRVCCEGLLGIESKIGSTDSHIRPIAVTLQRRAALSVRTTHEDRKCSVRPIRRITFAGPCCMFDISHWKASK